jgi:hypothetical protein
MAAQLVAFRVVLSSTELVILYVCIYIYIYIYIYKGRAFWTLQCELMVCCAAPSCLSLSQSHTSDAEQDSPYGCVVTVYLDT